MSPLSISSPLSTLMKDYSSLSNCKCVRSPPLRVLRIGVDEIAGELTNVNNSNPIQSGFDFVISEHQKLALFSKFYNDLDQTLRKEQVSQTSPTAVPMNIRHQSPSEESVSSGGPTHEHFTNSTANSFFYAAFEVSEVKRYGWWGKDHTLRHAEFSSCGVSLIAVVLKKQE
jgi:hypothetical protein